ncbi:MAG: hypothetical protein K1X31_04110 [Gemmatimonadaceae bacterium]|nr:hypothetical protein [Gemmatimonadaceae bacterium]
MSGLKFHFPSVLEFRVRGAGTETCVAGHGELEREIEFHLEYAPTPTPAQAKFALAGLPAVLRLHNAEPTRHPTGGNVHFTRCPGTDGWMLTIQHNVTLDEVQAVLTDIRHELPHKAYVYIEEGAAGELELPSPDPAHPQAKVRAVSFTTDLDGDDDAAAARHRVSHRPRGKR